MIDVDGDDQIIKFSQFYSYLDTLGSGGFGKVVKALNTNNEEVAVKIIPKREFRSKDISKFLNEANILSRMKHQNIVAFKGVKETDTKILIEMALVKYGQLKQLFNEQINIPIEQQRTLIRSLFSAVDFIHSHGVVHRDLKPENILVEDPNELSSIKVVDFGLSSTYNQHLLLTGQCGTLIYMAPELFSSRVYSKPVDIWSCGIILYMVCSNGQHPIYKSKDSVEQYKERMNNIKWEFPPNFNPLAKNLFLKCVAIEPTHRYTANQILQHPWITGNQNDPIPLSIPEMFQQFTQREKLLQLIKGVMWLKTLKKSKLDVQYLEKCNRLSQLQLKDKPQSLLDKEYVKDMMKQQLQIQEKQKQLTSYDSIPKVEPLRYETMLKRIQEKNVNQSSATDESSSVKNSMQSQQSEHSQKQIIVFQDTTNHRNILVRKQQQVRKKQKKVVMTQTAKKASPLMMESQVARSRSTTTNNKNTNEVNQFESPKRTLKFIPHNPPPPALSPPQKVHEQINRKNSIVSEPRVYEIKQRSNTSSRKLSIVEQECIDAYKYEQEKAIHSMFMPRGYAKKLPFQRIMPHQYIVQPQLIEINKKHIKEQENDLPLRLFDSVGNMNKKPPLPLKRVGQFEFIKKK